MGTGGDIRIEANGNACPDPQGFRDLIEALELAARLCIDGVNTQADGHLELSR